MDIFPCETVREKSLKYFVGFEKKRGGIFATLHR